MTIPHFLKLLGKSAAAWNEDDCSGMGAAIAFYTLFSIAPLLVIVIGAASLIFGHDVAQWQTIVQLRGLLGDAGAHAVLDLLASANSPATSTLTAVVSTVLLLFGATAVFTEVYGDFNRIWHNPSPPKATDIWYLIRTRIFSFGLLLGHWISAARLAGRIGRPRGRRRLVGHPLLGLAGRGPGRQHRREPGDLHIGLRDDLQVRAPRPHPLA